jgi:hypothetical protein
VTAVNVPIGAGAGERKAGDRSAIRGARMRNISRAHIVVLRDSLSLYHSVLVICLIAWIVSLQSRHFESNSGSRPFRRYLLLVLGLRSVR